MTVRLDVDEAAYQAARKRGNTKLLHEEEPVREYHYWRIVKNRFPHTKIADENHMLVLKRACAFKEIAAHEWDEFHDIVMEIGNEYDSLVYNFPGIASVKSVPHYHLYRLKEEYR